MNGNLQNVALAGVNTVRSTRNLTPNFRPCRYIYKSLSKQKSEIYLNILEEDATELMLEECTSSSHDKLQLAVKVFYAQFDLTKVKVPIHHLKCTQVKVHNF